jgi:hypothetical protein
LRDEHRTRLLVTLMEQRELSWRGLDALADKARALGIESVHAPVRDFGAPPSTAAASALIRRIVDVADDGHVGFVEAQRVDRAFAAELRCRF